VIKKSIGAYCSMTNKFFRSSITTLEEAFDPTGAGIPLQVDLQDLLRKAKTYRLRT
jgi:uncharacterized protein (DUF302 family)